MAALIPSASASGSGTMTLAGPSTNSNQTITIPDATGTMMVSGNMPAFSAYKTSNQTISSGTPTKVTFGTEEFDTNSYFLNSTFTPLIAGYYQINAMINSIDATSGIVTATALYIYKNGSRYLDGNYEGTTGKVCMSSLVYCNGTTDYIEIYAFIITTGTAIVYGGSLGGGQSWFNGSMVRGA